MAEFVTDDVREFGVGTPTRSWNGDQVVEFFVAVGSALCIGLEGPRKRHDVLAREQDHNLCPQCDEFI